MDDYRKLSREWGRKARKEESRQRKRRLTAETRKEKLQPEIDINEEHDFCSDCGAEYTGFHACEASRE